MQTRGWDVSYTYGPLQNLCWYSKYLTVNGVMCTQYSNVLATKSKAS